jgi:hypothetical protein
MPVPRDIQRRMDKTKARRERKQRNQIARATKGEIKGGKKSGCFLFGLILCVGGLVACGPVNLNHAPLTPTHAAQTVSVPVPAVTG